MKMVYLLDKEQELTLGMDTVDQLNAIIKISSFIWQILTKNRSTSRRLIKVLDGQQFN